MVSNLSALGVSVPNGFATTAAAYRRFIGDTGLAERITQRLAGLDTDDTQELLTQYAQLDSYGRHTVATVLKVEAERCRDAADTFSGQAAAYGGSFTSVNMPTKNAADAADALRVLKARDSLENKE